MKLENKKMEMENESFDFLQKLMNTISPSGFEEEAARIWKDRTKKYADEIKTDVLGNSIAVLKKNGNPKIMIAGHIDEIGYMVKYINKEGYVYFSTIGGIDLHLVPGQRVWIKTKKGKVLGVIGKKPVHLLEEEEKKKVLCRSVSMLDCTRWLLWSASSLPKPMPRTAWVLRLPTLLVMTTRVLLKSTVWPWLSLNRPSSKTCNRILKTSRWAFSISSSKITQ